MKIFAYIFINLLIIKIIYNQYYLIFSPNKKAKIQNQPFYLLLLTP